MSGNSQQIPVLKIEKPYPPEYIKEDGPQVSEEKTRKKRQKKQQEAPAKKKSPIRIRDDVEIDPSDLDAQIKRCEERLEQGYAKKAYEYKLNLLRAAKDEQRKLQSQNPGKSWEVIQRLESLETIKSHLEEKGDPCKELANVRAIIAAYKADQLQWDDRVTFWCQGKQIAGPFEFSWDDFEKFNTEENRGGGGFWVEGHDSPTPLPLAGNQYKSPFPATKYGLVKINFVLRLDQAKPGSDTDISGNPYPELDLQFIDDTGSSFMTIYHSDMLMLMGDDPTYFDAPFNQLMGYSDARLADGTIRIYMCIALEVKLMGNLNGTTGPLRDKWTKVMCAVINEQSPPVRTPPRLSGNWLREILYVGTAPCKPRTVYVTESKDDLNASLPTLTSDQIEEPSFIPPRIGAAWSADDANMRYRPDWDRSILKRAP